jgi:hypothetical protein
LTLFTTTNYPISSLIEDIDLGKIGLPELQRPFVWPNVNVRNLFDSIYRGYPAGFLLFWDTGAEGALKTIGTKGDRLPPKMAIVDGQQRLTSLYAVIKGAEVIRADFSKGPIRIAFNPLTERFDVPDATTSKDRAYIPDISVLWRKETKLLAFTKVFLKELAATRDLNQEEEERIEESIGHLFSLPYYQFTALTLSPTVGAETIAEVFVRINGSGKKLNQSDFIMTLMSVFWDEGRADLETFALNATKPADGQASPYNHFIKPSPDQMLRVTVGLSLKRARLEAVYNALRGRDPKTGLDSPEKREDQFAKMRLGQKTALNLANWHHFLSALTLAGYRGDKMISSETVVIYSYVFYLIGIGDFAIPRDKMRQVIAEFYFMAALTGRYSFGPEGRFDSDLAMVRDLVTADEYLAKLREMTGLALTEDYWTINLPSQLATSASQSPSLFAYNASLIRLDAVALYSPFKIASLVDPAIKGSKAVLERHHLFPRGYLEEIGQKDIKQINQIANFAAVEWPQNIKIGKQPPREYVPRLDAALSAVQREQMYFWHAMPPLWWEMDYQTFLVERRLRMARVIRSAWEDISGKLQAAAISTIDVTELIVAGEGDAIEFKSTLRTNLHTGQHDDKMQLAILKTIAGFLNAKGGTLLIGVSDSGDVLGLDADGFPSEDKMGLHLVNLMKDRMGEVFMPYVHYHFEDEDGGRVLAVRCDKGPKAAFVKDGSIQRFYVRGGASTQELQGGSIPEYCKQRFG